MSVMPVRESDRDPNGQVDGEDGDPGTMQPWLNTSAPPV
jgi:hypothetical protein